MTGQEATCSLTCLVHNMTRFQESKSDTVTIITDKKKKSCNLNQALHAHSSVFVNLLAVAASAIINSVADLVHQDQIR